MKLELHRFRKAAAAVLSCVFILQTAMCPQARADAAAGTSVSRATSLLQIDPESLRIPEALGTVEEFSSGGAGRSVILIQDAHAVPDAQKSIRDLIGYFETNYGIRQVLLEGASGSLDAGFLRNFPDTERLKRVLGEYGESGELAGGPAASIFAQPDAIYRGIEDWALYEKGLKLYRRAIEEAPAIETRLAKIREGLQEEKKQVYSKELLEVDETLRTFASNGSGLSEVLERLSRVKPPAKSSELALLLEPSDSAAPADAQIKRLALRIKRQMEKLSGPGSGTALARFQEKTQQYHTSQISLGSYGLCLRDLIFAHHLTVKFPESLASGAARQKRLDEIKGTRFFSDFVRYAAQVKESLFRNDEERRLDQRSAFLERLERMARLELTPEDWELLQAERGQSPQRDVGAGIDTSTHRAFYEIAGKRDLAFLERILSLFSPVEDRSLACAFGTCKRTARSSARLDRAIFVAGGFHARQMMRLLKANGVSYVLISPRIDQIPETVAYGAQMRGDFSWKPYFKPENGKVNLYDALMRAMRDRLLADRGDRLTLKTWRDQILRDLAARDRIADAPRYTRFLDELIPGAAASDASPNRLVQSAQKFADGLRRLYTGGRLTQSNVLGLLKSSMTQSLVVAGFQPESFVASAAVIPEPHDSGLVDAVQGLRAETRQVRSSKPVVLEDAEGLPAIGFDSGAVFKTYARRDFWSLVDGKRLPLRSEIRGKDDGQTPGAPRLIGVDFGDITTVYGHQVLLEKLKRLWDPENPVKLVIQGYERPVGPDGNIGEVFHRRTKIFRNLSSPYHQRFYHFDWSVEGHRRVLTVRGLDRAEMRTESVWYQRPLTKGIDAGAVRGGLTGVRAQIDRINQELRSLASDDDPDLYFEEDELAEEWIHPYVQAVKEFNQRITADGPVTAWDMEREYIRLHDTLGRGIIRTAGRYGLLSPEQLGELVSIFVEMFSQRFAEKLEKDPVWAAVNIFVRLVNLQPFYDGNKRAASFILNFILLKAGYEPFILRPKNAVLYRYIMHAIREDNRINEKEFRHFLRLHTKRRSEMRSQPEDDFRRLMKAMREAVERTDYPAALETLRQMHAHPSFPSQDLAFRQTLLREYVNFAYVTGDYSLAITVAESLMGSSVDQAHPAALDYLLGMSYHGLVSDELQAGEAAFGANNQEAIDHLSQCLAAIESGSAPAVMAQDVYFVLAMSYKTQGGLYRRNGDFVSAQESYQEAETLLLRSLARSGFDIRQLDSPKLRLPNSFDVASLAPMKLDPQVLFELVRSKILARKNDGEGDNALSAQEVGLLHNLLNLSLAFEPSMPDRKILFARIHAQLGQLLYDMYAQGSSDGRFIARAVEHLRGAIRDDPGYEESHYWLAEALFLYADHVSGLSGRTSDVPRYLRESLREFEAARGMPQRSGQSQAKIEIIHRRLQNLTKKFPRTEMRAQTRSAPKSIPLGAGEFDDAAHPYVGYAAGFLRGFLRRIEPAAGEFSQSDRSASASADLSWAVQNSFRAFSTEFTRSYYEIAGDMKYERFWERPYLIVKDTEAWLVFKDGKNGLPHGSAVVAYRIDLTQPIASQADLSASDAELLEVLYDEQPLFAGATFGQLERFHLAYRAINHGNAVCFESFMSPLSSGWGLLGSIMDLKKDAAWLRGREILGAVIDEIHRNPMLSWGTSEERNSKIIDLNVYLKWREWFAQSFRKFAVLNEPMRSVFSRVEAAGVRKTLNYKTALEDLYRANLTAFEGLHALTESGDMSALEGGVERMHSSLEVLYQAFVPHVWYQNYLLDLDHDMTAQEKTEFLRRFVERSKDWPYMVTFPAGDDRFFELPLDGPVVWLAFIIDNALRGAEKISQEAGAERKPEVSFRYDENYLTVTIEDFATGIPPEHWDRISDMDFTTKRGETGQAVAFRAIQDAGGRIEIDSLTPAQAETLRSDPAARDARVRAGLLRTEPGLTYRIYWPLKKSPNRTEAARPEMRSAKRQTDEEHSGDREWLVQLRAQDPELGAGALKPFYEKYGRRFEMLAEDYYYAMRFFMEQIAGVTWTEYDLDDFRSEALIAGRDALVSYLAENKQGYFSTYANNRIKEHLLDLATRNWPFPHSSLLNMLEKIISVIEDPYLRQHGDVPRLDAAETDLKYELELSREQVLSLFVTSVYDFWHLTEKVRRFYAVSLEQDSAAGHFARNLPVATGDRELFDSALWGEPAREELLEQLAAAVQSAFERLNPQEKDVVARRFGIGHDRPWTLKETGEEWSRTKERIRQIQAKGRWKLRSYGWEELAPFRGISLSDTDQLRWSETFNPGLSSSTDLQRIFDALTYPEARVLILRQGLLGERRRSLLEVAGQLGLNRDAVIYLEGAAIRKLKGIRMSDEAISSLEKGRYSLFKRKDFPQHWGPVDFLPDPVKRASRVRRTPLSHEEENRLREWVRARFTDLQVELLPDVLKRVAVADEPRGLLNFAPDKWPQKKLKLLRRLRLSFTLGMIDEFGSREQVRDDLIRIFSETRSEMRHTAQEAASVFIATARGEMPLDRGAEKIFVLAHDAVINRSEEEGTMDIFLEAFVREVGEREGAALEAVDRAVQTAMNDIEDRVHAYLETKPKRAGGVAVLSMTHEDMAHLRDHADAYRAFGANLNMTGVHGLNAEDYGTVRSEFAEAGGDLERPASVQRISKSPDQIANAALNQNFVPVIFSGESKRLDAQKLLLLAFGIDSETRASSGDTEDVKAIKDRFSIFMLWALAAVAPYAEIDEADVRILQQEDKGGRPQTLAALQHIRAALIKELTEILSGKDVALEGLFARGLDLNAGVLSDLMVSYETTRVTSESA